VQFDEGSDTIAELGSLVCSPGPDIKNVKLNPKFVFILGLSNAI
jgi:hypothetical protein